MGSLLLGIAHKPLDTALKLQAVRMEAALAYLIAFWLDPFLHGAYVILFYRWASLPRARDTLYFTQTCWLVFVLVNFDAAITFNLLIEGFYQSLDSGGPIAYFAELGSWQSVAREINYQVVVSICDLFMVYRVWRLYDSNIWITMLPFLLLVAETAMGITATVFVGLEHILITGVLSAMFALQAAVQIVITVLIGYRMLKPQDIRLLPPEQRSRRYRITRAIVESGLVITIGIIFNFAFFLDNNYLYWTFNLLLPHIYALTTLYIVLRLRVSAMNGSNDKNSVQSTQYQYMQRGDWGRPRPRRFAAEDGVIKVQVDVESDEDPGLGKVFPRSYGQETSVELFEIENKQIGSATTESMPNEFVPVA